MPDAPRDPFRIYFVGDVHGQFDSVDARFLAEERPDLTVFVGDLGDEDPQIVRDVMAVDAPVAVLLGNHDAWQSFSTKRITAPLRESLDVLGDAHLAYQVRELPQAGISLIGARPFSWGGRDLRSPEVYHELYGVSSHEDSAEKIAELASRARYEDIVLVAHNGPKGLGGAPADLWGKDFGKRPGGDWGDKDLQLALSAIQAMGKRVRAVIAGHMHDRLFAPRGAMRKRFLRRGSTRFLNCAVVPRLRRLESGVDARHYLRTDWGGGRLLQAEEIWVDAFGQVVQTDLVDFPDANRPKSAEG